MIRALVFDFDGTIIDTETAWYVAFREAYAEHGVTLTLEQYSQCIGTSLGLFNPYEHLKTHHGIELDLAEFRDSVRARHAELMKREAVRPGVEAFLKAAKEAGLKLAVASSSAREWVVAHLEQLGLTEYFTCIRTADDVRHVKPNPELYLKALDGLGVEACEAIAIEDSPNGAKAALAAGMACVLAPNEITRLLDFPDVPHRVNTLEELDFHHLIAVAG
ncbi:HAD family hydrolase [Cohnella fermenti]|uniref:HAD family hydrolase n=1 Tax=Cohnella fermenti TaxID=2565925 RepID=A0A4S4BSN4_9BACL|nr:HAD-IA family hydrolase [Cohnella fermenti]THF78059.1 HAD family hydrolase [Cohnella fermenti]